MIVAMSIIGVLLASVASVTLIAGRAMPTSQEQSAGSQAARELASRVLEDVQLAQSISAVTPTSITMTIGDQNGDGTAETVNWSWSGTPINTLSRSYNGVQERLADVQNFEVTLFARTFQSEETGAPVISPERLLARYTFDLPESHTISGGAQFVQYVCPTQHPSTTHWRPMRLELFLKSEGTADGTTDLQLRAVKAADSPAGRWGPTLLAKASISENNLSAAGNWVSVPLVASRDLLPDEGVAILLRGSGLGSACTVPYTKGPVPAALGSCRFVTVALVSTHYPSGSLSYRLYGTQTSPASASVATSLAVRAQVRIALNQGAALASRLLAARPVAPASAAVISEDP
jgi:type II secretory pathway pseudopilin PulG